MPGLTGSIFFCLLINWIDFQVRSWGWKWEIPSNETFYVGVLSFLVEKFLYLNPIKKSLPLPDHQLLLLIRLLVIWPKKSLVVGTGVIELLPKGVPLGDHKLCRLTMRTIPSAGLRRKKNEIWRIGGREWIIEGRRAVVGDWCSVQWVSDSIHNLPLDDHDVIHHIECVALMNDIRGGQKPLKKHHPVNQKPSIYQLTSPSLILKCLSHFYGIPLPRYSIQHVTATRAQEATCSLRPEEEPILISHMQPPYFYCDGFLRRQPPDTNWCPIVTLPIRILLKYDSLWVSNCG